MRLERLRRWARQMWDRNSWRAKRRAKRMKEYTGQIRVKQLECVSRIQRAFRSRFYRFDREVLIQRLELEVKFGSTGVRLLLSLLLFLSFSALLLSVFDSVTVLPKFGDDTVASAVLAANVAAIPVISSAWLERVNATSVLPGSGVTISGFVLGSSVQGNIVQSNCMSLSLSSLTVQQNTVPFQPSVSTEWTHIGVSADASRLQVFWNGAVVAESAAGAGDLACLSSSLRIISGSSVIRSFGVFGTKASEEEIAKFYSQYGLPRVMVFSGGVPPNQPTPSATLPGFMYLGGGGVGTLPDGSVKRLVTPADADVDLVARLVQPVLVVDRGQPTLMVRELKLSDAGTERKVWIVRTPLGSFTAWFVVCIVLCLFGLWWNPREVNPDWIVLPFCIAYAVALFAFIINAAATRDSLIAEVVAGIENPTALGAAADTVIARCVVQQNYLHVGTMLVLYPLIWRVLAHSRMHPRIGLLANTLTDAASEVLHFFVSFFIVTLGLALVGVLTLSRYNSIYSTVAGSYFEIFEILFGDDWNGVGWEWRESFLAVTYFILVPLLCVFTLLNFLLAVILDTYVKVREGTLEGARAHKSILGDLVAVSKSAFMFWAFQMPPRGAIVAELKSMCTRVVDVHQLERIFAAHSELKVSRNVIKFCQFYHSFPFLKETSGLRTRQFYDQGDGQDERAHRRLIDTTAQDADSRLQVVATQLKRILVELQIRKTDHDGLEGDDKREKVIQEYRASRQIDSLTRAQIKSRYLQEYRVKAEQDAAIIRSLSKSRTLSRGNILQSFLVDERDAPPSPIMSRVNRSSLYNDR